MVALETPVLSVAIDAVSKVDGEKALCGLITLFSKCKSGLQDGPRLENMAWRLWHVERFERSPYIHHLCFPASPDASSSGGIASPITSCPSASSCDSASVSSGSDCSDQEDGEHWDKDELTAVGSKPSPLLVASPSPLNDVKDSKHPLHTHSHPLKHRKPDMSLSESPPSRRNSRSRERSHSRDRDEARHPAQSHPGADRRPSFSTRRTHSNTSVGKIMADLLPEKLDVMELELESKRRRPSSSSTTSAATAAIGLGLTTKELSEEDRWRASSSTLARDDHEPEIVTVVLPEISHQVHQPQPHPRCQSSPQQGWDPAQLTLSLCTGSTSGPLLVTDSTSLPNVVIVHPTPHHTPPMTPQASPVPAFGPGPAYRHLGGAICMAGGSASDSADSIGSSHAPAAEQTMAAMAVAVASSSSGQVRRDLEQRDRGRERERDSLAVPTRAQARQAQLLVLSEQRHPSPNSQIIDQAQPSILNTSITPTSDLASSCPETLFPATASGAGGCANLQKLHVSDGLQTHMSNSQHQQPAAVSPQLSSSTTSNLARGYQRPGQSSHLLPSSEARSNFATGDLNTRREGTQPAHLSATDMGESAQGAGLSANSRFAIRSEDGREGASSLLRDDNAINSHSNAISNRDLNGGGLQPRSSTSAGPAPNASGQTLQPPDQSQKDLNHKFFISPRDGGSQDGDSPETSASSQVGSHSVVSASVSVSNSGFTGDPASVASRTSTTSQTKSTSSGRSGSSRGGLKMRSKMGDLKGKGKGKEVRLGPVQFVNQPPVRRSQSGQRIYQQVGDIGTVHRSLMGGRTAAATALNSSLRRPMNNLHAHIPKEAAPTSSKQQQQGQQHPPPKQASKPPRQSDKAVAGPGPSTTATTGAGGLKSPVSSSSGRRNSSHSRSRPRSASGWKTGVPSTSTNKHRIDVVDDSDYSTEDEDEEWDTEDGSEEVERADRVADDGQRHEADSKLVEAAAEAQRHRDLFSKVDRRSYTQLKTSNSGLLSQIFHPPPELFPLDHPYRHTRSTQDILAHVTQGPARQFYMPGAMTAMQSQKSSIALPAAANVVAQGMGSPNNTRKSPLRKPPQETEMESDSGDDTENKLDMSKSLAQKKLEEHMTRSSSRQRQQQQKQQQQSRQLQPERQRPSEQHQHRPELPRNNTFANPSNPQAVQYRPSGLHTVATAPIDLGYPYNLPIQQPPSTPRTTRRNFLLNELSESLRLNLLWERQVSKRPTSTRRPATAAGAVKPMTAVNGQNGNVAQAVVKDDGQAQQARKLARTKSLQEDFGIW